MFEAVSIWNGYLDLVSYIVDYVLWQRIKEDDHVSSLSLDTETME